MGSILAQVRVLLTLAIMAAEDPRGVPEPGAFALAGVGLIAVCWLLRRRKQV